jgi:hypothetical protein
MTVPANLSLESLRAYVEGIGLIGPGLTGWPQGRQCLDGSAAYVPARSVLPAPAALPSAERRRAGAVIKISLGVAQEAVETCGIPVAGLPSVFSSSSGDPVNCHEICSALASNDRLISPTRFHNSVHNASSGYWSISSGAMATSSVLCARDAGFSAGLLEAMTQCAVDDTPVLLVVYDTEYPEPLFSKRSISDSFGIALVLSPQQTARSQACIGLDTRNYMTSAAPDAVEEPQLEALRRTIPAAAGLPLLQAIARREARNVALAYLEPTRLAATVAPC